MNALVIATKREMLCKRCAGVRVRMRAGKVLGMSAGEERSALAGGGWANLASLCLSPSSSSFGFSARSNGKLFGI